MKVSDSNSFVCPDCDSTGKRVKKITLRSLLQENSRDDLDDREWLFCRTPDCDTVYFEESGRTTFSKDDLTVRVGIKETESPRPICYCFNHTVEEIDEEVARTGSTTVLDDIKSRMKEACWCETTNPMGSCCLATVTKFVKIAQAQSATDDIGDETPLEEDCCASHQNSISETETPAADSEKRRFGMFATGGAVLSSILSSACCWLPLLLLAFGASAAGVAGFFEAWRPWFLGGAVVLLGLGFYFVYFRKEQCGPDDTCSAPNQKLRRFNRAMLWMATIMVITFALFPDLMGKVIGTGKASEKFSELIARENVIVFPVDGMTCETCAVTLEISILSTQGVEDAAVDYSLGKAIVVPSENTDSTKNKVAKAIEAAGYIVRKEN